MTFDLAAQAYTVTAVRDCDAGMAAALQRVNARLIMQGKMKLEEVPERRRDTTAELVNFAEKRGADLTIIIRRKRGGIEVLYG